MTELPNKPSKLIRLALADLVRAEHDPLYEIHMGTWHSRRWVPGAVGEELGPCSVCFAGVVMAFSLELPIGLDALPECFSDGIKRKLFALDSFRCGGIQTGLAEMGLQLPSGLAQSMQVPPYDALNGAFHAAMNEMANLLERNGL